MSGPRERAVVVVTRVAVKFGRNDPDPEWTEGRRLLLQDYSAPSVSRFPYEQVAWVWLCSPERFDQVRAMAAPIVLPNGSITVAPVEKMFDVPDPEYLADCHPDAEDFLTFRLDADDAYLPDAVADLATISDGTIVDFANGFLWDGRRMRRAGSKKQGPFLALANEGRQNMVNQGGEHRHARVGRTVLRVDRPAWVQTVHGANYVTSFGSRRKYWQTRVGPRQRRRVLASAGIPSRWT